MEFPKTLLRDIIFDDGPEEYELIENKHIGSTRWSEQRRMVFAYAGKFYASQYSVGLTENQYERPYEYEQQLVECQEVFPVEKTIIEYR